MKYVIASCFIAALGVSSCGSSPPSSAPDPGAKKALSVRQIADKPVLVNANGRTLYTNEAESDGKIRCVKGCAEFWPPEPATSTTEVDGLKGKLGKMKRPDNSEQLTLDGLPLYTFADDRKAGEVKGDGFTDDFEGTKFVWHVVTADGAPGEPEPSPSESEDDGGYSY